MNIAQGDVYLDPQTLEDLQHDTITSRDPADKKEKKAKGTKPAAYKAKLLLTGEQSPIGQFQSSGTRVSTRIYFDTNPHWSSSIRIEIKA